VKEQIGSVGISYTLDMARERNNAATIILALLRLLVLVLLLLRLLHCGYLDIR
jgi:ABC-type nitrate/sulfonate/bicarbonate transport system permease component